MPQENVIKHYSPNSYYHIYNHLVPELGMALDEASKAHMTKIFHRHLHSEQQHDRHGHSYRNLSKDIDLLAYCIMDNHFHLLVYQKDERGIEKLMRSIATSYSMYLNKSMERRGAVFESVNKAVLIKDSPHLFHISRYIHRNPGKFYEEYEFSSYGVYSGRIEPPDWIRADKVLDLFSDRRDYVAFCAEDWIEGST